MRTFLCLFTATLLLRAAMPFLANASAEWQGQALAEVCSVHGVALVAVDAERRQDLPAGPSAGHAGDRHCVPNALSSLGATCALPPPLARLAAADPQPPAAVEPTAPRDATAHWVARRRQGPPGPA